MRRCAGWFPGMELGSGSCRVPRGAKWGQWKRLLGRAAGVCRWGVSSGRAVGAITLWPVWGAVLVVVSNARQGRRLKGMRGRVAKVGEGIGAEAGSCRERRRVPDLSPVRLKASTHRVLRGRIRRGGRSQPAGLLRRGQACGRRCFGRGSGSTGSRSWWRRETAGNGWNWLSRRLPAGGAGEAGCGIVRSAVMSAGWRRTRERGALPAWR